MTKKSDFNAEEWSTVVEGPLLAGLRVVTADRGGTLRESLAMGRVYTEARQRHGESELLDELVSSPPAMDPQRLRASGDVRAASAERLRDALGILGEKASPEDVEAYKRFVLSVAEAAARAHKEGGFVGIGGKDVSESEQAALDEIAATLGTGAGGAG
jgi:hypothetical protein